jgi:hypothetical protein
MLAMRDARATMSSSVTAAAAAAAAATAACEGFKAEEEIDWAEAAGGHTTAEGACRTDSSSSDSSLSSLIWMRRGLGAGGWGLRKPGLNAVGLAGASLREGAAEEEEEEEGVEEEEGGAGDTNDAGTAERVVDFAAAVAEDEEATAVAAAEVAAAIFAADPSNCASSALAAALPGSNDSTCEKSQN